jgi:hypothetical protein
VELGHEFDGVRTYLQTLDMVAAGGTADGDRTRSRIAANIRMK